MNVRQDVDILLTPQEKYVHQKERIKKSIKSKNKKKNEANVNVMVLSEQVIRH